ncbi:uncharacterized protein METZ01_LOCUS19802 [marine metagenome]|uniref:Methyltransferase type 11 domain-containing protein n=1 Tax=marine metagenome TaxID=408172 RepID=A0A381PKH9_9ZZZZ|tara:strand:+ start:231 stop:1079 length:849 start_codon:yes stop_codon:yes gene_type:complete
MKKEKFNYKIKDHFLSKEVFSLALDRDSEILRTRPKPALGDLPNYYDSKEYLSHQKKGETFLSKIYFVSKKIMLFFKTRIVTRLFYNPGKALDVGSGTGDFLLALKTKGWDVVGVEPAKLARREASKLGIQHVKDIKNCDSQEFDLVTFWHSLEHVYSLNETLASTAMALKKGGQLIIACPNYKSWDAKYYKKNWAAWDVPRHLRHFSPKSLRAVLEPMGFEQTKAMPLLLDSFYISILSEKIKESRTPFLKGVVFGMISNLNGLFYKNFSSQAYIFRKKSN